MIEKKFNFKKGEYGSKVKSMQTNIIRDQKVWKQVKDGTQWS